jgi:hypothetical protein
VNTAGKNLQPRPSVHATVHINAIAGLTRRLKQRKKLNKQEGFIG